jgi:hypothetical protein
MAAAPSIKNSPTAIHRRGSLLILALVVALATCAFGAANSNATAVPSQYFGPLKVQWQSHNGYIKTFRGGTDEVQGLLLNPSSTTVKGTATLFRSKKGRIASKSIGDGDFTIGNGQTQTLVVSLNDAGQAWVKKHKSTRVRVRLKITDNAGGQPSLVYSSYTLVRRIPVKAGANDDSIPQAVNDSYSLNEGGTVTVNSRGLLANDHDADDEVLLVRYVTGPAHAKTFTLGQDGSFSYTAAAGYSGTDQFTYQVFDGRWPSNIATVKFTIKAKAPAIATIPAKSYIEGAAVNLPLKSFVTSSATVTYTATGLPSGWVLDPATGIVTGTAPAFPAGPYSITLSAKNSTGTTTKAFAVTITAAAPTIATIPDQSVDSGDPVSIDTSTYVTSNAPVTYSADGLPAGVTIDPTTGLISGTSDSPDVYTVTLHATNSGGATTKDFNLEIVDVV